MDHNLVEILFLFGLDDAEFTHLFAQFNTQSMEKLCAQFKEPSAANQEEDKILGVKEDVVPVAAPLCDLGISPRQSKRSNMEAGFIFEHLAQNSRLNNVMRRLRYSRGFLPLANEGMSFL